MGQNVDRYLSEQMISQPDFHKRYDEVVSLEVNLKLLEERLSDGEREYLSRKLNLEQYPSLIQIVERGEPSSFKARPKRSLILLGAIIATFLFSIFVVLIVDREKEII